MAEEHLCQGPGLLRNFNDKIHVQLTKIFKPGIWLAGSTAASQSEAMLENPCYLKWNLTWILFSNPQDYYVYWNNV